MAKLLYNKSSMVKGCHIMCCTHGHNYYDKEKLRSLLFFEHYCEISRGDEPVEGKRKLHSNLHAQGHEWCRALV